MQSADQCVVCRPGTACPIGAFEATACSPGTHNPLSRQPRCVGCNAGTFQNASGATSCHACPAGSYCEQGATTPLPCKAGSYSSVSSLKSADECALCPAGSHCIIGSVQPTACRPGTVTSSEGLESCAVCPAGWHQPAFGGTSCLQCKPGHWCTRDAEIICSENTFNPSPGASLQTSCERCPVRTSTLGKLGSTRIEDCACAAGYYFASANHTAGRAACEERCCLCMHHRD